MTLHSADNSLILLVSLFFFGSASCHGPEGQGGSSLDGLPLNRLGRAATLAEKNAFKQTLVRHQMALPGIKGSIRLPRKEFQQSLLKALDVIPLPNDDLRNSMRELVAKDGIACAGVSCQKVFGFTDNEVDRILSETATMVAYSTMAEKPEWQKAIENWLYSLKKPKEIGVPKTPRKPVAIDPKTGILGTGDWQSIMGQKVRDIEDDWEEAGIYIGSDGITREVRLVPDIALVQQQALMDFLYREMGLGGLSLPVLLLKDQRLLYAFEIDSLGRFGGANHTRSGKDLFSAYIFVARNRVLLLGKPAGHVGWGFEFSKEGLNGKRYFAGSIENVSGTPFSPSLQKGTYRDTFSDKDALKWQFRDHAQWAGYTSYRKLTCECTEAEMQIRLDAALKVAKEHEQKDYFLLGSNCLDDTYHVLKAAQFVEGPHPCLTMAPNHWFDRVIPTNGTQISDERPL